MKGKKKKERCVFNVKLNNWQDIAVKKKATVENTVMCIWKREKTNQTKSNPTPQKNQTNKTKQKTNKEENLQGVKKRLEENYTIGILVRSNCFGNSEERRCNLAKSP